MGLTGTESIVYAVISGIGLLVTVYAMLNGSVRAGRSPDSVRRPPAGFNTPVIGTALMAFGVTGYLIAKYSQVGTMPTAVIAVLLGAGGWIGMTTLMARWALRGPLTDPHEELEELQGTIATVTRHINAGEPGEISYSFRGKATTAPARSISGLPVPAGTEVVIDMINDGVAEVELWSVVETRL